MKLKKLAIISISVIFASCGMIDDGDHYESFGVVENSETGKYILTDDNKNLHTPANLSDYLNNRVWVMYSVEQNKENDININLKEIVNIIEVYTQTGGLDTLVNNKVYMRKAWITRNHLTLDMNIDANSSESLKKHVFAIYSDNLVKRDTLHMTLFHDMRGDNGYNSLRTGIFVDLSKIQGFNENTVVTLKYNDVKGDMIVNLKSKAPKAESSSTAFTKALQ